MCLVGVDIGVGVDPSVNGDGVDELAVTGAEDGDGPVMNESGVKRFTQNIQSAGSLVHEPPVALARLLGLRSYWYSAPKQRRRPFCTLCRSGCPVLAQATSTSNPSSISLQSPIFVLPLFPSSHYQCSPQTAHRPEAINTHPYASAHMHT
jgi:hypothetical protein